jgi:hypothetical protein
MNNKTIDQKLSKNDLVFMIEVFKMSKEEYKAKSEKYISIDNYKENIFEPTIDKYDKIILQLKTSLDNRPDPHMWRIHEGHLEG